MPPLAIHVDGTAGTGKSFLISAISTVMKEAAEADAREKNPGIEGAILSPVFRGGPSGIAAYNIRGETLHSGLGIQVSTDKSTEEEYQPCSPAKLGKLQQKLGHVRYMILDEKSMIGLSMLARVDLRLGEIMSKPDDFFGGVSVLLFGDFGQLPPVGDSAQAIFVRSWNKHRVVFENGRTSSIPLSH